MSFYFKKGCPYKHNNSAMAKKQHSKDPIYYCLISALESPFFVAERNNKICGCGWQNTDYFDDFANCVLVQRNDRPLLAEACKQLDEYFAGNRTQFDLPLLLEGTDFQRKAWTTLCNIPYGETVSYGEEARRMGMPKAVRAVGGANHANPIAIIVPCHRVIAASGKLCGYGGGVERKVKLLALEKAHKPQ